MAQVLLFQLYPQSFSQSLSGRIIIYYSISKDPLRIQVVSILKTLFLSNGFKLNIARHYAAFALLSYSILIINFP